MFLKSERETKTQKGRKNRFAEVANILEELVTAFIMALLIVTFVLRPFIIPTGSMANTLKGAYFRMRCPQCGYRYSRNFDTVEHDPSRFTVPASNVKMPTSRCPSCGYYQSPVTGMPITKGDKILVLKCMYQLFEPKQWDVIVFRYPVDPSINYIKRLVGRPEETVEIIDGDVYINGQISRKPPKVQNELWMPIYNNDYQPARPTEGSFNGHIWKQPFDVANSAWTIDKDDPTTFCLDTTAEQTGFLSYNPKVGNDFRASYAYNDVRGYDQMPYCSDLMVSFYANQTGQQGLIGIELSKYQNRYRASFDSAGQMVISQISDEEENILASKTIETNSPEKPSMVKFANVDHQLIFQFGDEKLTFDLGRDANAIGPRKTQVSPQAKIFGSGNLQVSHVAISRDIYYTYAYGPNRAGEGNPLKLEKDQFFVLGDNSPNSADGRVWNQQGISNIGKSPYPAGIVPRDYLVGKAAFVFWPSGFKPFAKFPFSIIPDIGRMRFIYGGSDKSL